MPLAASPPRKPSADKRPCCKSKLPLRYPARARMGYRRLAKHIRRGSSPLGFGIRSHRPRHCQHQHHILQVESKIRKGSRTYTIPTSIRKAIYLLLPVNTSAPLLRSRVPTSSIHAFCCVLHNTLITAKVRAWGYAFIGIESRKI
jgi:hypothetical protein